jgi:hypothetical protein
MAGLSATCAAWDQPVVIGAPSTGSAAGAVEVLPAEKFSPFIVPFRGRGGCCGQALGRR